MIKANNRLDESTWYFLILVHIGTHITHTKKYKRLLDTHAHSHTHMHTQAHIHTLDLPLSPSLSHTHAHITHTHIQSYAQKNIFKIV